MGREVKRVPLDFDWPVGRVWLGYMAGVCEKDVEYVTGGEKTPVDNCEVCRHAARLAGIPLRHPEFPHPCPAWSIEPPKGDGWQMWETTSEGSPMSPVFKTPEELAKWLADTGASAFGSMTATYDQWLQMIGVGSAPSAFLGQKGLQSGVEAMAELTPKKDKP